MLRTDALITALVDAKREAKAMLPGLTVRTAARPDAAKVDATLLGFLDLPCIKALPPELQELVADDYFATPYLAWAKSPRPASAGSTVRLEFCDKATLDAAQGCGGNVAWTLQAVLRSGTADLDERWLALKARLEAMGRVVRVLHAA